MPGFSGHDISAIIPTYNRGALLRSTIRSILAQSTPPGEIIVVDDGSTDDTAANVSQFGTAVRYHRIPNSGAPIARNTGAALAQKPWLWFCDSDDVWRPHYIATVCTLLNASPEPRFVFGNFCLVHDGFWDEHPKFATCPSDFWPAQAVNTDAGPIFIEPLYQRLLHFQPIFHSTLVVSRTLFADIGGYSARFARVGSEDFEFVLRCSEHGPTGVVHKPLVGIRRHSGNYSGNQIHNLLGEIEILRHARTNHALGRRFVPRIDKEIALRSTQALELAFSAGHFDLVKTLSRTLSACALSRKARAKVAIAAMPPWIRSVAFRATTLGQSRQHLFQGAEL